jgi:exopolysaccharide biosynthesis polyprenyl glycosylphosphotransferase
MIIFNKKEPILLFLGDIAVFSLSLWFSLWIRSGLFPSWDIYKVHFTPFIMVFLIWTLVFFIAGLYDKYTTILKDKMPAMILNTQLVNSAIVIAFFYLIPYFGITPKTILFIDIAISLILIYLWRIYSHSLLGLKRKEPAIILGRGEEMERIVKEVNENPRSELRFVLAINLDTDNTDITDIISRKVREENVSVIVADFKDDKVEQVLSHFYNLIFSGVRFINIDEVYEHVFDRIPVTLLKHNWFLENISTATNPAFVFVKRFFDILSGLIIGIVCLMFMPFVALAIKLEDRGDIFFAQERISKNNKTVRTIKFRSMSMTQKEHVTKVGRFLRRTRIDELPQAWNLFVGDLSLVGPRPETPALVRMYEEEIPYYNIRHLVKPGLSGWAQICQENPPKYGVDFNNTKDKLSYDLYYIKNKSFILDLHIILKTLKELVSRRGK